MKHTPDPVWIGFERYQVLPSSNDILFTNQMSIELGSFSFTDRSISFFLACISVICPNGQNDQGVIVSIFLRKIYPKTCSLELEQTSISYDCKFLTSALSTGELKFALPIRKWFRVIILKSFISFVTVSGLLFKDDSTSVRKITNDSS